HQNFTGSNTFSGVSFLTNSSNSIAGTFAGDGSSLSNVSVTAGNVTGTLLESQLPVSIPRLDANGRLPDTNLSSNVALLNSSGAFAGSVTATTFNGNAAGLSNLNSANLTGPIIVQPTFGRGHTNDGGSARGVAVLGRYAYVADELNGLLIYDISNPAMPMRVS